MSKEYEGSLLNSKSPSGEMLYGTQKDEERKDENKQYKDNKLNEQTN